MLSQFVDNALPSQITRTLEEHLTSCPACQQTVKKYQNITNQVVNGIQRHSNRMNDTEIEKNLLIKIRKENAKKKWNFSYLNGFIDFIKVKKIYLQMASFAAILLLSMAFLQDQRPAFHTPSAIVNSIDGEMASVMILETPDRRHTIIWYKES